jgi:hypothetical protein
MTKVDGKEATCRVLGNMVCMSWPPGILALRTMASADDAAIEVAAMTDKEHKESNLKAAGFEVSTAAK